MSNSPATPDDAKPDPAPQRPSLLTGEPRTQGTGQPDLSILAALDGRASASAAAPRRHVRSGMVATAGAVLLAGALLWVWQPWHSGQATAPEPSQMAQRQEAAVPVATSTVATAPVVAAVDASVVPVAPAPASAPASAAGQLAALEDTAPSLMAAAAPVAAAAALSKTAEPAPAASAAAKPEKAKSSAAPRKSASSSTTTARNSKAANGSSQATKTARAKPQTPRTGAVAAGSSGNAVTASAKAKADSLDADVELIAAIMRRAAPDAAPASRPDAASARTSVTANDSTSIAALVRRCSTLSGSEAQRCQQRICDDYWGRADACPRGLAPSSNARQRNGSTGSSGGAPAASPQ